MTRFTYCGAMLLSAAVLNGQVSVLTWHNDNSRTGQNLQETILTPANVNSATFGRLATLSVDGKVDAEPRYVAGLTFPTRASITCYTRLPSTIMRSMRRRSLNF